MAQSSQAGSPELSYNWKLQLETLKMNVSRSQTNPPASQVTTYSRFSILEATEDSMDTTEAVNRQHTQRTPPPPPIFIDDVIDIQTITKTIRKDISRRTRS